ncbi:hypothetical protein [Shewanella dokdonensis]|uniref:Uncharacterized protein n=1 Tax=Shewanella dokdonensis TaxID=712036 RepID=A0ABX8DGY5_9GAMM|nr:hypothetical protein [Shewanella dokdonensis]MCL1074225.1 hypothetical protein [Shewanella dokdonensis]QVK23935.1 hypothetical protein KHX94_04635 [Shewanella dokdonensis]
MNLRKSSPYYIALAIALILALWLTLKLMPWELHWLKLMIPSFAIATPHWLIALLITVQLFGYFIGLIVLGIKLLTKIR